MLFDEEEALRDESSCGSRCGRRCLRADIRNRGAFSSCNLLFRGLGAARDEGCRIFLRLGHDQLGFLSRCRLHGFSVLGRLLGLGFIVRLDRFRLLTQIRGGIQLFLDAGNLLVERACDHRRNALPQGNADHDDHGKRNPHGRIHA